MAVIDSNNFITHLVWSGLVDKATCGELKEAIERYTVKDIYTKDDMIAMLTDLQLEIEEEAWVQSHKGNYEKGEEAQTISNMIQSRIDKIKENKNESI